MSDSGYTASDKGAKDDGKSMVATIASMQDYDRYRDLSWDGSFEDYLAIVRERPQVTRNAFQRVYDMVISYGTEEYIDNKKKLVRYNFFKDEQNGGANAIFGLDIPLMRLVHVLRAASERSHGADTAYPEWVGEQSVELGLRALNEGDRVADGLEVLDLVVGDANAETLLGVDDNRHHRQRVDVEVVGEGLVELDLSGVDAGLFVDDFSQSFEDFLLSACHV